MHTADLDQTKCIEKLIIDTQENIHPTFIIKPIWPIDKVTLLDNNPMLKGFEDIDESDRGLIRSIDSSNFNKKFEYLKDNNKAYVVFHNDSFFNLKNVLEKSLAHNIKIVFIDHPYKIGHIDFI